MNCADVTDALDAYDAGDLSSAEVERVEEHLAICPPCRLEHEVQRQLAADLRRAGRAVMPLRVFSIPSVEQRTHRRRLWVAVAAAAVVWAAAVTVALSWPSLAARLTFFPVGQALSSGWSPSSGAAGQPIGSAGHSPLGDIPAGALSAAATLFETKGHARDTASAITATAMDQLSRHVDLQHGTLRVLAVGPVVGVGHGQVNVVVTVELVPTADVIGEGEVRRYDLLTTLSESADGRWVATKISLQ